MPDRKTERIKVTFDKKELRTRAHKFTYRQARRHAGNFYQALVQELLEDGCLTTAKYFEIFAAKENDYYARNVIRDRVVDYPNLLMSLYDNCKMAERSALLQQCEGMTVTFNLLYQVMLMLEQPQYAVIFNWLLKDVYEVVAKISDKLGPGSSNVDKPISQIYLKYANLLSQDTENMSLALHYYEKAIGLTQANKWISDSINSETHSYSYMHTVVAHKYVEALLKFGTAIASDDYLRAVALSHKALCVLTQVGHDNHNLHQFVNIHLHMAEFYMEGERYNMAHSILDKISDNMCNVGRQHYEKLALRLQLDQGICYTKLNQNRLAMEHLSHALALSQKLTLKSAEAQVYMSIGKLYLQEGTKQRILAKNAFLNSKKICENLNDPQNRKKNIYLLAQTMSASVFPLFMDLMKSSEKSHSFFSLRRWKYQLKPFWHDQHLRSDGHDEFQSLMEEFVVQANVKELLKI